MKTLREDLFQIFLDLKISEEMRKEDEGNFPLKWAKLNKVAPMKVKTSFQLQVQNIIKLKIKPIP